MKDFSKEFLNSLASLTKSSAFLNAADLPFYKTMSQDFNTELQKNRLELLAMLNTIVPANRQNILDSYSEIIEKVDDLLEKAVNLE